jgi:hypothetical protein
LNIATREKKALEIHPKMPSNSTDASKHADEIQVAFSHEELHSDDDLSPKILSRVKLKLDLFILPLISIVYFFAQMVRLSTCHDFIHHGMLTCR